MRRMKINNFAGIPKGHKIPLLRLHRFEFFEVPKGYFRGFRGFRGHYFKPVDSSMPSIVDQAIASMVEFT